MSSATAESGAADPLVVSTADLAPYLNEYLEKLGFVDEDPTGVTRVNGMEVDPEWGRQRGGVRMVSPLARLAEEAELDVRRIRAFRKREQLTVTVRVVEKLASAMDAPYLLNELPVYRNPIWSVPKFMRWLSDQGLTPEDIDVKGMWAPGAGYRHLEQTVSRIRRWQQLRQEATA